MSLNNEGKKPVTMAMVIPYLCCATEIGTVFLYRNCPVYLSTVYCLLLVFYNYFVLRCLCHIFNGTYLRDDDMKCLTVSVT